jgi:hypothetical protein
MNDFDGFDLDDLGSEDGGADVVRIAARLTAERPVISAMARGGIRRQIAIPGAARPRHLALFVLGFGVAGVAALVIAATGLLWAQPPGVQALELGPRTADAHAVAALNSPRGHDPKIRR